MLPCIHGVFLIPKSARGLSREDVLLKVYHKALQFNSTGTPHPSEKSLLGLAKQYGKCE